MFIQRTTCMDPRKGPSSGGTSEVEAKFSQTSHNGETENESKETEKKEKCKGFGDDGDNVVDIGVGSGVQVFVRARPMSSTEIAEGSQSCMCVEEENNTNSSSNIDGSGSEKEKPQLVNILDKQFEFDYAFHPVVEQEKVYTQTTKPLLSKFFEGYNATVFAYGQTGSGKTYTMGSGLSFSSGGDESNSMNCGIIPRLMRDAFKWIEDKKHVTTGLRPCRLRLSYLEIYNENVKDLLRFNNCKAPTPLTRSSTETTSSNDKSNSNASSCNNDARLESTTMKNDEEGIKNKEKPEKDLPLQIREDPGGAVVITNLSIHNVPNLETVSDLLYQGSLSRSTASTNMNLHSSRSHAICTLYLHSVNVDTGQDVISKFHLVDLAGSERAKRTGAEGSRLKEGISINRGLFALGNVISALTSDQNQQQQQQKPKQSKENHKNTNSSNNNKEIPTATHATHVPYRDSKITRLLQDSLGGNSFTAMIACVSPADSSADESINTLRYAQRARKIKNLVRQNVISGSDHSAEVQALKRELRMLQLQVLQGAAIRGGSGSGSGSDGCNMGFAASNGVSLMEYNLLKEENKRLRENIKTLQQEGQHQVEESIVTSFKVECQKARLIQLADLLKTNSIPLPEGFEEEENEDEDDDKIQEIDTELFLRNLSLESQTISTTNDNSTTVGLTTIPSHSASNKDESATKFSETETNTGGKIKAIKNENNNNKNDNNIEGHSESGQLQDKMREEKSEELIALEKEIRLKETAALSMGKEQVYMTQLRSYFEKTIERLQTEVSTLGNEKDKLASMLVTKNADGSTSIKKTDPKLVKELHSREKELNKKIGELRMRERQYNNIKNLKKKAEEECVRLKSEIGDAKKRHAEMLRSNLKANQRLTKEKRGHELEAARLRRNENRMQCQLQRTKEIMAKTEAVLKRKLESANASHARSQDQLRKLQIARNQREDLMEGGWKQKQRRQELMALIRQEVAIGIAIAGERMKVQTGIQERALATEHIAECQSKIDDLEKQLSQLTSYVGGGLDMETSTYTELEDEREKTREEQMEWEEELRLLTESIQDAQINIAAHESSQNGGNMNEDQQQQQGMDKEKSDKEKERVERISILKRWGMIKTMNEARYAMDVLYKEVLEVTNQSISNAPIVVQLAPATSSQTHNFLKKNSKGSNRNNNRKSENSKLSSRKGRKNSSSSNLDNIVKADTTTADGTETSLASKVIEDEMLDSPGKGGITSKTTKINNNDANMKSSSNGEGGKREKMNQEQDEEEEFFSASEFDESSFLDDESSSEEEYNSSDSEYIPENSPSRKRRNYKRNSNGSNKTNTGKNKNKSTSLKGRAKGKKSLARKTIRLSLTDGVNDLIRRNAEKEKRRVRKNKKKEENEDGDGVLNGKGDDDHNHDDDDASSVHSGEIIDIDDDSDSDDNSVEEIDVFSANYPLASLEPLNKWTVVQLKKMLSSRSLPVSGNKAFLIERLRTYEEAKTKSSKDEEESSSDYEDVLSFGFPTRPSANKEDENRNNDGSPSIRSDPMSRSEMSKSKNVNKDNHDPTGIFDSKNNGRNINEKSACTSNRNADNKDKIVEVASTPSESESQDENKNPLNLSTKTSVSTTTVPKFKALSMTSDARNDIGSSSSSSQVQQPKKSFLKKSAPSVIPPPPPSSSSSRVAPNANNTSSMVKKSRQSSTISTTAPNPTSNPSDVTTTTRTKATTTTPVTNAFVTKTSATNTFTTKLVGKLPMNMKKKHMQHLKAKINPNASKPTGSMSVSSTTTNSSSNANDSNSSRHIPLHLRGTAASTAAGVKKCPSSSTNSINMHPHRIPLSETKISSSNLKR